MVCRIVDANNFGREIFSKRIWLNYGVTDGVAFNKQVTMTWNKLPLIGSSISNGIFGSSYVYKKNGNFTPVENALDYSRYGTFGSKQKSGSKYYTTWTKTNAPEGGVQDNVNISLPAGY